MLINTHPEFQSKAVKSSIAVFSRDVQKRFDCEADAISNYQDFKEIYNFFDKEYLSKKYNYYTTTEEDMKLD